MTEQTIIDRVFDVLATTLDVERGELTLDTDLKEDLEADSLDLTALAIELENVFEGDVEPSETDGFEKVRDIVSYIENRLASAAS
jgi:acyl carrier protein